MGKNEIDIPLSKEEEKEKIEFLKNKNFNKFKIHQYYPKNNEALHPKERSLLQPLVFRMLQN